MTVEKKKRTWICAVTYHLTRQSRPVYRCVVLHSVRLIIIKTKITYTTRVVTVQARIARINAFCALYGYADYGFFFLHSNADRRNNTINKTLPHYVLLYTRGIFLISNYFLMSTLSRFLCVAIVHTYVQRYCVMSVRNDTVASSASTMIPRRSSRC